MGEENVGYLSETDVVPLPPIRVSRLDLWDGVSFPGCISSAITIGAIQKPATPGEQLKLADFSNRFEDKLVDLVTFGVAINSSVPGGQFSSFNGTSMATPHAAGAYAVLAQAFPNASVDDIERAMKETGVGVNEPFSGKKLPAIKLAEAYNRLGGGTAVSRPIMSCPRH